MEYGVWSGSGDRWGCDALIASCFFEERFLLTLGSSHQRLGELGSGTKRDLRGDARLHLPLSGYFLCKQLYGHVKVQLRM